MGVARKRSHHLPDSAEQRRGPALRLDTELGPRTLPYGLAPLKSELRADGEIRLRWSPVVRVSAPKPCDRHAAMAHRCGYGARRTDRVLAPPQEEGRLIRRASSAEG
jgi:hypothetical protein